MNEIAIIGAGVAGLSAAWSLARQGIKPVVFEKSRGLSGRAASRSRGDVRFDHGANFFKLSDPLVAELLQSSLPADDLVEIPGDVWTFDALGEIYPGDPAQNAEPKWTYRKGISQLGKLLAASAGLEVQRETRVARVMRVDGGWELEDDAACSLGVFERVVFAAPAPQCREVIEASTMDDALRDKLGEALGRCRFHRQFSFILGYDRALSRSQPFHALVSTDPTHAVSWLSFEEDKPGHLPEGMGALVVQMSPEWTDHRVDVPRERLVDEVSRETGILLGNDFRVQDWWDSQRWMLAHPASAVDAETLKEAHPHGLYFAGDSLIGRGRVPLAIASGLKAAEELLRGRSLV